MPCSPKARLRIDQVPKRLEAVRAFMELPEATSLAAANKRIGNILKKADGVPETFDRALLLEPAEQALGAAFADLQPAAEALYARRAITRRCCARWRH